MKIANRDLTLVGVKLIGLWLLFHSVLSFAQSAMTGGGFYYARKQVEARQPWQPPEGVPQSLSQELTEKWRMDDSMQKMTYQIQMFQAFSTLPWNLVMALIGLYLCRSGNLVLRFLCGKDERNPNNTSEGIRQPGDGSPKPSM